MMYDAKPSTGLRQVKEQSPFDSSVQQGFELLANPGPLSRLMPLRALTGATEGLGGKPAWTCSETRVARMPLMSGSYPIAPIPVL